MTVLGIETSCDETAVAIVRDGNTLLADVVASSMDIHVAYGGVVPEVAARSHIEVMIPVVAEALQQAFPDDDSAWDKIDAIAVVNGAGLGGSLLVGVMTARTLAIMHDKPLYAINHVEAHVYANFLTALGADGKSILGGKTYAFPEVQPEFPMLALIVSGGHSQLVLFRDHFDYELLGITRDDAIGEAFDKVAKITGLPYPGGPNVSKAAEHGDDQKYQLPKARLQGRGVSPRALKAQRRAAKEDSANSPLSQALESTKPDNSEGRSYDFSFSGLKTAVLRLAQKEIGEDFTFPSVKVPERLSEAQKSDIAASFQRVAIETLVDKTVLAYEDFQPNSVVIAGGVAANQELRTQLRERIPIAVEYPDMKLCTDNGAMVATLGCFKASLNQAPADPYSLSIEPNLTM